jgi:hypothetical protein
VRRMVNLNDVASPSSQTFGYPLHVRYPVVMEGPHAVWSSTVLYSSDRCVRRILVMLGINVEKRGELPPQKWSNVFYSSDNWHHTVKKTTLLEQSEVGKKLCQGILRAPTLRSPR